MKKSIVLFVATMIYFSAAAQHFYYLDTIQGSEKFVESKLKGAHQFVIDAQMAADYILKTTYVIESANQFSLKMTLVDSISLKTILQAEEKYDIGRIRKLSSLTISFAIQRFFERNLNQIILASSNFRQQTITKELQAKKDRSWHLGPSYNAPHS